MNKIESAIQKAVISWCRQRPLFALAFHVNNEGAKSIGQGVQDKRLGTLPGVPDICIPLPHGRVLWLELKTKKGRLSNAQKALHREMRDIGHDVVTAFGYEQAIEILETIDAEHEARGRE